MGSIVQVLFHSEKKRVLSLRSESIVTIQPPWREVATSTQQPTTTTVDIKFQQQQQQRSSMIEQPKSVIICSVCELAQPAAISGAIQDTAQQVAQVLQEQLLAYQQERLARLLFSK
jgi:hypothetical protein